MEGGACGVMVISSKEIDTATKFSPGQNVCISYSANTLGKSINLTILLPAIKSRADWTF